MGWPVFVKPANMGSSVGVSKARKADELAAALSAAFRYDTKVLIERGHAVRELECGVLGNDDPRASVVGESSRRTSSTPMRPSTSTRTGRTSASPRC